MDERQARIEKIRAKINELEKELTSLKANRGIQNKGYHDPYSDQTYGSDDFLDIFDTNQRIQEVSIELSDLRRELQRLETLQDSVMHKTKMHKPEQPTIPNDKVKTTELPKGKSGDDKETKQLKEADRLYAFKQVKKAYKRKGRTFDRFVNFITGKKPKWRQIKQYDQKELDHLLATIHGETTYMKDSIRSISENPKYTFNEQQRHISNKMWNEFVRVLTSEYKLNESMRYENIQRGGR